MRQLRSELGWMGGITHTPTCLQRGAAPLQRRAPQASRGGGAIQVSNALSGVPPPCGLWWVWKPPLMLSEMLSDAWMFSTLSLTAPSRPPSLFRAVFALFV